MSRVYFFGDASVGDHGDGGHFLHAPGRSAAGVGGVIWADHATPWAWTEFDGVHLASASELGSMQAEDQPQGQGRLVYRDGWTMLSFWDRTGDRRTGCNSALVAEGELDFEQMTALFQATFPALWARITAAAPVTLHPNSPPPPVKQRISPAALRFPALAEASSAPPAPVAALIGEALADELLEPVTAVPQEARRLPLEGLR